MLKAPAEAIDAIRNLPETIQALKLLPELIRSGHLKCIIGAECFAGN